MTVLGMGGIALKGSLHQSSGQLLEQASLAESLFGLLVSEQLISILSTSSGWAMAVLLCRVYGMTVDTKVLAHSGTRQVPILGSRRRCAA